MVELFRSFSCNKFGKLPVYQNFLNFCKFRLSLLVLASMYCGVGLSQNQKIDSLIRLLPNKVKQEKFDLLFQISYECIGIDNRKALEYISEANAIAYKIPDSLRIVKAGLLMNSAYRRLEMLDSAISVAARSLSIAKRNKYDEEIKILLNSLAIAYSHKADYDNALEYNFQSLIIREKLGNKSEISITLNNIGFVYFKLRNYEKALEYYKRSLELKEDVKDNHDLDRLLINIGLCHVHLKNFHDALENINKGLQTCGEGCDSQILIEAKFGIGVANFGLQKYDLARVQFLSSLDLARKSNSKRFQAENLVYLGKIDISEGLYEDAKVHLKEASNLANGSGYNQLRIDIYRQFSILFTQLKDFENASVYQNKYITLKDSLIGEDLVKNVAKIQTNFEERENLATIKLKELALSRQRNLNIAIGVIAVLAVLFVVVLYRSTSVTRKVNSALSDAKAIIETQNKKLKNINRELDGLVKEKTAELVKTNDELDRANHSLTRVNAELDNFIYKTSHDIRGPLASLRGICSVALMDVKDSKALDYLVKLDSSAGRLNVILTRLLIINQINSAVLNFEAIDFEGMVDDILLLEKKKGLPERLKITKHIRPEARIRSDKELVQIILENLIDNAIKFYNDSDRVEPMVQIDIQPNTGDKGIIIKVIDNGIGVAEVNPDKIFQIFSRASERSATGGIGLYLTKLATEKLGGSIQFRTSPEGNTEFSVVIPEGMHQV